MNTNGNCLLSLEGVGKSTIITSLIKESFIPNVSMISNLCGLMMYAYLCCYDVCLGTTFGT